MQTFIHKFLIMYRSEPTLTFTTNAMPKDIDHVQATPEPKSVGTHIEEVKEDSSKSWRTQNGTSESSLRRESPSQVLQAAKNEKVKLISHFTGSENSLHWLKKK
ncbi:unnamed protein product [Rotaria socialis]|uniref:Uncharacterized protein n=2 Tax=Rotaria socialis TaxID=392032 RepID=A0A820YFQ6_9BILA|nr:unnamed protein product [Rotaria socialis]CAF3543463.1 unnamed protein product [Rotaria socialis]CAF4545328.1 unnamed protein product [Rotaria socialis]CAF4662324.1 unnamed protein product [Rotaria socialis]CAF4922582.1 unnamed protein product [Rotaria socialis]